MSVSEAVEKHHKVIIAVLLFVVVFFALSCIFHEAIPVCSVVFGCGCG